MIKFTAMTAAALSAAFWVLPAAAQDGQQRAQRSNQQPQQQQRANQQGGSQSTGKEQAQSAQPSQRGRQPIRVTGRLTRIRTVDIGGQQHVLGIIESRAGSTLVVDLGTPQEFRKLNAKRNQTVQATGRAGRINQRPVLVAELIKSGDASVRPKRPMTRARQVEQQMATAGKSSQGQQSQQQQQGR